MSEWLDRANAELLEAPAEGDFITIQERVPVAQYEQGWGTYTGITRTTEPFWRSIQSTDAFHAPPINWAEIDREMDRQARQREDAMLYQRVYHRRLTQMLNQPSSLWELVKDGRAMFTDYPEELKVAPGL